MGVSMQVFKKEYWNSWLEKFFSLFISVKMIVIGSCTAILIMLYFLIQHLLMIGKITSDNFTTLVDTSLKYWSATLAVIVSGRAAIEIVDVIKGKLNKEIQEKVKDMEEKYGE